MNEDLTGCWIEGGMYTVEEGNHKLIALAQEYGYKSQYTAEELDEDPEELDWESQRALNFLNKCRDLRGYVLVWDCGDLMCERVGDA